jgi:predicted transcriptional regulator
VIRVRVSDDEKAWLEELAREDDRKVSDVIRIALKRFYESRVAS